ncbi:hypothetical protein GLGCALEP_02124 [Pseudomonas sp. MM221]|nr:hypothetical protein GLGCALEP_02124 [Pseudomonas sp. MM221]
MNDNPNFRAIQSMRAEVEQPGLKTLNFKPNA